MHDAAFFVRFDGQLLKFPTRGTNKNRCERLPKGLLKVKWIIKGSDFLGKMIF